MHKLVKNKSRVYFNCGGSALYSKKQYNNINRSI